MTLCIAAVSQRERHIIVSADSMLSADDWSTETRVSKIEAISPTRRWVGMFAGEPTVWHRILGRLRESLNGQKESLTAVEAALAQAFADEERRRIEERILSPLGMDRPTFIEKGLEQLGEREFSRLLYEIRGVDLGTAVMIAGFEPEGSPRILCASNPGDTVEHERLGFHAIGTGSTLALASLWEHYDAASEDTKELTYRVCEAQFKAQRALGVGERTTVMVLRGGDGEDTWIHPSRMAPIREIYEKARPPIPTNALRAIEAQSHPFTWRSAGKRRRDP